MMVHGSTSASARTDTRPNNHNTSIPLALTFGRLLVHRAVVPSPSSHSFDKDHEDGITVPAPVYLETVDERGWWIAIPTGSERIRLSEDAARTHEPRAQTRIRTRDQTQEAQSRILDPSSLHVVNTNIRLRIRIL